MEPRPSERLRYSVLDPTGNITALVESAVEVVRQPAVAAALMERHPEVEQVGFVSRACGGGVDAELRMAGGEFCGNASMSAAALYLLRERKESDCAGVDGSDFVNPDAARTDADESEGGSSVANGPDTASCGASAYGAIESEAGDLSSAGKNREHVMLRVSGAGRPVEVRLVRRDDGSFDAGVLMPEAQRIERVSFCHDGVRGELPLVHMEGISHVVVEPDTAFFWMRDDRVAAEAAVRSWCADLHADGLGLMFLERNDLVRRMTPLVYVPGSGTVFWENSCASGSSAVAMCLAQRAGARVELSLEEPGGILRVASDPATGETWLYGSVRLVGEFEEVLGTAE